MATRLFRANNKFYSVESTRYLLIPTTNVTTIVMSTGFTAIRVFNSGSNTLIWGDASVKTNSGNFLFPLSSTEFSDVIDHFTFSMMADSANSFVTITEYK
mgnify:CR=1 FL=1